MADSPASKPFFRILKAFSLAELLSGMALTLKYMFLKKESDACLSL